MKIRTHEIDVEIHYWYPAQADEDMFKKKAKPYPIPGAEGHIMVGGRLLCQGTAIELMREANATQFVLLANYSPNNPLCSECQKAYKEAPWSPWRKWELGQPIKAPKGEL